MAVDHALLEQVHDDGIPILRLYRWQPACLSFGRNQPAKTFYDESVARDMGIDIVRRPTGGLSVLHVDELTYAFVAPSSLLGGPRATYCTINKALVSGLKSLGVPAELSSGQSRSPFGSVHPCFAEPAAGEVVAQGAKLVGSAQRTEKHAILQHGSILLDGNQDAVGQIATVPFQVSNRATSIKELLGSLPDLAVLTAAIARGFEAVCGTRLAPSALSPRAEKRASELLATYQSAEWTWRR